MPFDGTLDFWVLLFITLLNVCAVVGGLQFAKDGTRPFRDKGEYKGGNLFKLEGDSEINLKLIATVFAMVESASGLLFIWCVALRLLYAMVLGFWAWSSWTRV